MTPQDTRSPFQQQRWIELYNEGDSEIPAFGVVEIVAPGSSRPESTGGYTPDGGRTMLHVQQPEASSGCSNCCLTVINGPCPIPVGKSGRIGTMDSPMLALVGSASYTTGTEVGPKAGSYALWEGYKGYLIVGDYDSGTGTMRVVKCCMDDLIGGCLYDDHPGRGTAFNIYLGAWNPATDSWVYDCTTTATAIDWRYGVPYPDAGATGLFKCRKSDTYGTIWEVVALDCEAPDESCCHTPTPAPTPTPTGA